VHISLDNPGKRQPINLTIGENILKEAKRLKLNTSKAAEAGILEAVRLEQERQWKEENAKAINAYNSEVSKRGVLLKPSWLGEE